MSIPVNLEAQIAAKTTDQLLGMFHQPNDWLPEALEFAKAELRRRGVNELVLRPAPVVQQSRGVYSLNGIGTTFYGQRDFQRDG